MEKPTLLSLALDYHREENLDPGELIKPSWASEETISLAEKITNPIEGEVGVSAEVVEVVEKQVEFGLQSTPPDTGFEEEGSLIAKQSDNLSVSSSLVEFAEEALESTPLDPSNTSSTVASPSGSYVHVAGSDSPVAGTSNATATMARGQQKMKVKVVNARNLTNKETLSTSDPMCMLELGKTSKKTKAINNNLNPDWNEEFTFDVSSESEVLTLSVWDYNKFQKNVFMGCAFVAFDKCKMGVDTPKTAKILGGSGGEINVVITALYETSASQIERMGNEIRGAGAANDKYKSDNEGLRGQVGRMAAENDRFSANNKKLEEENKRFEESNNRLEASVNKLEGENLRFEENNKKLEQENARFEESNNRLEESVNKLEGENKKFEENNLKLEAEVNRLGGEIDKMSEENNKFAANNEKLEAEVGKLEGEVSKMGELNNEFEANNKKLQETVEKLEAELNKMTEENNKFAANNLAMETQVNSLSAEVEKMAAENNKFEENNKKMEAELTKMGEENVKLEQNIKNLEAEIAKLSEQVDLMAAENAKFAENNENLKQQVDALSGENAKFAENNKALEENNNVMQQNNAELSGSVSDLKAQAAKFKEVYEKLKAENEKLSEIRDGLQDQLNGFKKLQQLIFSKLNEKMRAMDRSLLEKIGADIEMMDKSEGLSRDEFAKFMKRVPTHLRDKFNKIADDFAKFDQNQDNVIDSDEFGGMLDQVMKETDAPPS